MSFWCCLAWRRARPGSAITAPCSWGRRRKVAPIDKLSVVLVAILGTVILGEKLAIKNWIGVALIAAGAILVAMES